MTQIDFPLNPGGNEVNFIIEDVDFVLEKPNLIEDWVFRVVGREGMEINVINFVFCSDEYLLAINRQFLSHDYLTDVISFPYNKNPIEGDIIISIDRVKDNAAEFGVSFPEELHRVMIHGVLHFCGYKDKTKKEQKEMRIKENEALAFFYS